MTMSLDSELIRELPLFQHLAPETLDTITAEGCLLTLAKGALVYGRGDRVDGFYVVCEGRLKLYMLSCEGSERILRVLRPTDSFGEEVMFTNQDSALFAETLTSVRIAQFPRDAIMQALRDDPSFTQTMVDNMGRLIQGLVGDIEACCLMNARQRTIAYLLRQTEIAGSITSRLELPASKWMVASMLNLTPETFSRELHRLKQDGLIDVVRRVIYVRDRGGLLDLASGASPQVDERSA
jgi:CRP-like cAMP-binding protein